MSKGHGPVFYDEDRRTTEKHDPTLLLFVTLFFALITASFGRYAFFAMLPLAAYPLYLNVLAKTGFKKIVFTLLPLSLFVFFIGMWNVFFDKSVIVVLGVSVPAGWISFATIMLKFLLAVSSVTAMIALTGFDAICRSLASVGLPSVLVNQFFLFYRYVRLINDEARNIIRARLFRGGDISLPQSGNICGPLVLRCSARAERIYDALACRGYRDVIYHGKGAVPSWNFSDRIFGTVCAALFIAVRFNLASVIGGLVLR